MVYYVLNIQKSIEVVVDKDVMVLKSLGVLSSHNNNATGPVDQIALSKIEVCYHLL